MQFFNNGLFCYLCEVKLYLLSQLSLNLKALFISISKGDEVYLPAIRNKVLATVCKTRYNQITKTFWKVGMSSRHYKRTC